MPYIQYIEAEKAKGNADFLIDRNDNVLAIPYLRKAVLVIQFTRESAVSLANIYFSQCNLDSALFFAGVAFESGAKEDVIQDLQFRNQLTNLFQKRSSFYRNRIKPELVMKLQEMVNNDQKFRRHIDYLRSDSISKAQARIDSINFSELRNIVLAGGWPGIYDFGQEAPPMITVVASHASKDDLIFFIRAAIVAATSNKSSWVDVESLVQSLMYNFRYQDRSRKLDLFELPAADGRLSNQSYLSLVVLVKSLIHNPFRLEIICFDEESKVCVGDGVAVVTELLLKVGLDQDRIINGIKRDQCDCISWGFIPYRISP